MRLLPSRRTRLAHGIGLTVPLLLALLLATPAAAVDGVIEINHTAALAGGITPADLPGYPVEIASTGSFVLTGNLTPAGASGIQLLPGARDVTIDLNGFSVIGAGVAVNGIDGTGIDGVVVKNGTVRDFGLSGMVLGSFCRVERVQVAGNGGDGLFLGANCLVIKNIIQNNAQNGVWTDHGCKLENNLVESNGLTGLVTWVQGLFIANSVINNGDGGIWSDVSGDIQKNVVSANKSFGIRGLAQGNVVEHNTVRDTVAGPSGPGIGIEMPADTHKINDNVVGGNADIGILCGLGCAINNNTVSFNGKGVPAGPLAPAGIVCVDSCTLNQNTASFNSGDGINLPNASAVNHSTASFNGDDGIECADPTGVPCAVNGCLAHRNASFGLNYSVAGVGAGGFRNNTFYFNGAGADVFPGGAGFDPGFQNVCSGAVPCP